ncbi:MAG TPA: alcohol dehydrogenase catalytic domain-containing protein, partial [Phnomibacter sp.]|nr:alcohol dehydrogenase catalytic domain-containing protein [Phnomibacter sp.]
MQVKSFAALNAATPLQPFEISRRSLRPDDVLIAIDYCGVCHSDLHQARNEWGNSKYPMVPGHEIVGRIVETGAQVSRYKTGDLVGVGVIVDSCGTCPHCTQQYEQYCIEGPVGTYNALERDGKTITQGGYSAYIVVKEKFVLKVDEKLDAKAVAPLLCAGITTYSPLRYAGVQAGMKVGVIGLGGLGHMG